MPHSVALSIVIPLYNEEGGLEALVEAVRAAMAEASDWELILVDDGSQDRTAELANQAARRFPDQLRVLRLARNYGQTAALQAGLDAALGAVIVTLDGDLQNDPADILDLAAKLEEGYDLVQGHRVDRQDAALTRKLPSRIANRLIRYITGVPIQDTGCSLKAFRREVVERMSLYSDLHRFIPAVAAGVAGARIAELPVRHHPRRFGASKYGLSRIWKVLSDLIVIAMIRWFRERPLTIFATLAIVSSGVAALLTGAFVVGTVRGGFDPSTGVVTFGAILLLLGLGFYLLMLGLIGEVVIGQERSEAAGLMAPLAFREGG